MHPSLCIASHLYSVRFCSVSRDLQQGAGLSLAKESEQAEHPETLLYPY